MLKVGTLSKNKMKNVIKKKKNFNVKLCEIFRKIVSKQLTKVIFFAKGFSFCTFKQDTPEHPCL